MILCCRSVTGSRGGLSGGSTRAVAGLSLLQRSGVALAGEKAEQGGPGQGTQSPCREPGLRQPWEGRAGGVGAEQPQQRGAAAQRGW